MPTSFMSTLPSTLMSQLEFHKVSVGGTWKSLATMPTSFMSTLPSTLTSPSIVMLIGAGGSGGTGSGGTGAGGSGETTTCPSMATLGVGTTSAGGGACGCCLS